jgi:deoxyribonuclease-4
MKHLLGAHTFVKGGPTSAIETAEKLKFNAIQIFTKNNNQWNARNFTDAEVEAYKTNFKSSNVKIVVAHDSYLINLCAVNKEMLKKSRATFIDELKRCEILEIPYLNFHPGSHGGQGEEYGIKLIAESINFAHNQTKDYKVKSMLELTAGQGTSIGYKFEQIKQIIDLVEDRNRMCVCIDTAHIYAAGYDIATKYKDVLNEFDHIIGFDFLKCFHMNDSKKPLGSRVDRHEHIGKGFIGTKGFKNIMNDERLIHIPKILETPKDKEQKEDLVNIQVLKKLTGT